jgi:16S rRNA (cytidine1402-2'-O)-methyltransferase
VSRGGTERGGTGDEGATGTLFVCAVPIGNLEDASPRLKDVLGRADAIACEDTRTTRKLLGLLEIDTDARLLAHHEHNERGGAAGIVALLQQGSDVALVSDAGTPAVSDPGVPLVDAAHAAGIDVVAVPGPSAVAAAVSIAGFAGSGFRFVGFLPRASAQLEEQLRRHADDVVVAFTSPRRLLADLDVVDGVQPDRRLAVCRELTKRYEQVVRGTAAEVRAAFGDEDVRGEIVLVLDVIAHAASGLDEVDDDAVALVETLVAEGVRTKRACAIVGELRDVSTRALFDVVNAARD